MKDIVIVPPEKIASPQALRKASRCSGMTCGAVAQAQLAAMLDNVLIEFRPSKGARKLRVLGHPGKPEWMKNNTITDLDRRLGAPAGAMDQVWVGRPKLPDNPTAAERARYQSRLNDYNDKKLQGEIRARIQSGEVRIENGILIDEESGLAFTGDDDLFAIREPGTEKLIPESDPRHQRILKALGLGPLSIQHPSLAAWNPSSPAHVAKRRSLIQSHLYEVPLIRIRNDGSIWYVGADPFDLK
jgi:hypothetical protein